MSLLITVNFKLHKCQVCTALSVQKGQRCYFINRTDVQNFEKILKDTCWYKSTARNRWNCDWMFAGSIVRRWRKKGRFRVCSIGSCWFFRKVCQFCPQRTPQLSHCRHIADTRTELLQNTTVNCCLNDLIQIYALFLKSHEMLSAMHLFVRRNTSQTCAH